MAFRVPAADIFVVNLTVRLEKATTYEQIEVASNVYGCRFSIA
jgi:glyceraldehyde-3-phosphate dehydrogenase/erythrose-4-phosphate dehydrogenase